jgi:hypothetical protein
MLGLILKINFATIAKCGRWKNSWCLFGPSWRQTPTNQEEICHHNNWFLQLEWCGLSCHKFGTLNLFTTSLTSRNKLNSLKKLEKQNFDKLMFLWQQKCCKVLWPWKIRQLKKTNRKGIEQTKLYILKQNSLVLLHLSVHDEEAQLEAVLHGTYLSNCWSSVSQLCKSSQKPGCQSAFEQERRVFLPVKGADRRLQV